MAIWVIASGIVLCVVGVVVLLRDRQFWEFLDSWDTIYVTTSPVGYALVSVGFVLVAGALIASGQWPFSTPG